MQSRLRADLLLARNSNKFLVAQNRQLSNELHAEIAALRAQVDESGAIAQKKEQLVSTIRDAIGEQQSALNECFAHVRHGRHKQVIDEFALRDDVIDARAGMSAAAQVDVLVSPRNTRTPNRTPSSMATGSVHTSNGTLPRFLCDTTSSWNKRRNQVNAPAF